MLNIIAQVVTVWVIFIQGPGQMTPSDFITHNIPQIQQAYLDIGVPVVFERVAAYTGDFPAPTTQNYAWSYYRKLYRLARELKLLRRKRIVLFIVPPSSDGGYMLGAARRFCFMESRRAVGYYPMAFGVGEVYNAQGAYRLTPFVSVELAHELGHSQNAQHQNDCSMMDTKALQCTYNALTSGKLQEGLLPWNKRSAKEIVACLNWKRKN